MLAGNGIIAWLTRTDAPTPAISYNVKQKGADAGIVITASHNPPRYNGFKLKAAYGGSATAMVGTTSPATSSGPSTSSPELESPSQSIIATRCSVWPTTTSTTATGTRPPLCWRKISIW